MKNANLLYTAIAAWGTWAAVVSGLMILWFQNRTAKRLTCLQLFMQIAAQYDSADMQLLRSQLARRLIAEPATLAVNDSLLVYYENLAILVRRGLLDADLVRNTFSIDVRSYWIALRHYVEHMRATFNDPVFFCEFEWLNREFLRLEGQHRAAAVSQVGRPELLETFLRMEALRSPVGDERSPASNQARTRIL